VMFLAPLAILVKILLEDPNLGGFGLAVLFCASIAPLWVSIAVSVRRLHDRNKDGSWYLVSLVPVIGSAWLLIECGVHPGTPGANDFGPRRPSVFDLPR
jgi:uncharacterized membrane protein YhaH (DUF805 family)